MSISSTSRLCQVCYVLLSCLLFVSCQSNPTPHLLAPTLPAQTPDPAETPQFFLTPSATPIAETETVAATITMGPINSWHPSPIPYTPQPATVPPDFKQLDVINRSNLNRLTEVWRYEPRSPDADGVFVFSSDGKFIAINNRSSVDLCDLSTGAILRSFTPLEVDGKSGFANAFAFSPDSKSFALLSSVGFTIWDVNSGKLLSQQVDHPDIGELKTSFLFSPDGNLLVTTGIMYGSDIRIWSAQTGKLLKSLERGDEVDADFSPDGKQLFISPRSAEEIHVWDTETWKEVSIRSVPGQSLDLELSKNGEVALVSSLSFGNGPEQLRIYSVKDWKLIGIIEDRESWGDSRHPIGTYPHLNMDGGIVMFSPSTDYSGDGSNQIGFWDTFTQKRLRLMKTNLAGRIGQALFNPDGRILAVSMGNGTILFYGVPK